MLGKWIKLILVGALLTVPMGCGAAGTRIQQERQAELMDEREDEMMNDPATEYRQEQIEDQFGE
ncbi:hypothetical protein [Ammoniphilus sp. YIM 78166]|uniref:hypothetical protein n=1 Tax=Ammoniphilus sp. YIM 78166 TaxID=1644106 RepID=UPI0014319270|nr:hypothetical protein [Ammoniphilus sp. YIM 78166]